VLRADYHQKHILQWVPSVKRLAVNLSLSIVSLLFLVILTEVILRVFNPIDLDWRMVIHHPVRVETLAPNFDGSFRGVHVQTNEFGHRVPTRWEKHYNLDKPQGVRRVLAFGDSFTFGLGWAAEDSFVEQLQQRLDSSFSQIQVLNFGVPGYNPYQELNYIRERALAFHPDVVIIQFTDQNDFYPTCATLLTSSQPISGAQNLVS